MVGPDISVNIPNGLRWSISHIGSASISGSGSNKSTIIHTNILQTRSWSIGLNTSIISSNNTQSGISSNYKPVREISSGFRVAKKINDTAGIAFGGERAVQWDNKNISSKNYYLMATKGWWLGARGSNYPLLIANGGLSTGSYSRGNNGERPKKPLRITCIKSDENENSTISNKNDLCWSPIASISIVLNDYLSSFLEYSNGTAQAGASISLSEDNPIRITLGVNFASFSRVSTDDSLGWNLRASIGF